jgi:predicted negative regulator of RcsB-dependent stress response
MEVSFLFRGNYILLYENKNKEDIIMNTIKGFVKKHLKKIIVGVVLTAITLGGYAIFKLFDECK